MIWSCDTCYNPIFLWRMRWKYFYLDLASPGWPRTLRRTSWWSTARETYVSIMDMWYMLLPYFFMVNTMEMFLFWFGVTRMALYTEKDILVKYNKRKLCLHYDCVIHVITVFFMVNTMEIFLSWFFITRMALNAEKDILMEYSKRNICSHYRHVIHVITKLVCYTEC